MASLRRSRKKEKTHGAAWFAKLLGDPTTVQEYKPPDGVCHVDDIAGRFRLHHKACQWSSLSIAWTERGMDKAVQEALRVLWSWERCAKGRECILPKGMVGDLFF